MIVRLAGRDEGDRVFRFLFDNGMHEENALPQAPLDFFKAKSFVEHLCYSEGRLGLVIVAETDAGDLAGTIGAELGHASWFSSAWLLYEKWVYVAPAYRRGPCALKLLRYLDNFGKRSGVPVSCGVQVKEGIDRKAELFARVFRRSGSFFMGGSEKPFQMREVS